MAGSKCLERLTSTHHSLLFHIKAHIFSKSSKLHTKLRQHGRKDFFAGKEADMVLEKERSSLFVSVEVGRVEGEKTKGTSNTCSC